MLKTLFGVFFTLIISGCGGASSSVEQKHENVSAAFKAKAYQTAIDEAKQGISLLEKDNVFANREVTRFYNISFHVFIGKANLELGNQAVAREELSIANQLVYSFLSDHPDLVSEMRKDKNSLKDFQELSKALISLGIEPTFKVD